MVGNIGLGKFNPIEMKEAKSSFAPKSSKEDSISSNSSSSSKNKTLEKSENKNSKKIESKSDDKNTNKSSESSKSSKSEFDKKVEKIASKDEKSESQNSESKVDPKKVDKKTLKELSQTPEIPQMMMLQGVQPTWNQPVQAPTAEVSTDKKVELNLGGKVSAQTQPVLKFMKAMQENFGISPAQIMKALGEMPHETLMQSPSQGMTPLFEKLGLQPGQFTKAQILYTEMLTEMEQVKPELFKPTPALAAGAGAVQASQLNAAELPAPMMEKPVAAPKSTLDQLIEQKISRRALEPQNFQGVTKAKAPQVNMTQIFNVDSMGSSPAGAMNSDQAIALDKLSEFDPNLRIENVKINPTQISDQFTSNSAMTAAGAGAITGATLLNNQQSDNSDSEDDLKENTSDLMMQPALDKKVDGQFTLDKLAPSAALAAKPTELSNENVEKILSGSKALIQKGGGEMKIQMNPEGLGKVHLDIKVKDGQVGIQMTADTQEAKKLLENSMNDLKLNLAEHKLNLNHVKVDVSEQAQNNTNQSHDFKREEARDFLGQFRQFNESFRQANQGFTGARAYKESIQATPNIQPIQTSGPKNKKSSDGRLHLVA